MSFNLKILPLLIFVAMLAFAVRLADVAVGVKDLSGSVQAADQAEDHAEKDGEAPSQPETDTDTMEIAEAETDPAGEDGNSTEGGGKQSGPTMEDVTKKWRDASDPEEAVTSIEKEVFDDLAKRRKELDMREKNLATREALLRAAEQELERKYQEMDAMRSEIKSLLDQQTEEEQKRIQSLVKIYEGMKPQQAATIFDTLDLDVLLSVMSLMSERRLSPILAAMNPERARTITIMLAEQKSLPDLPTRN